MSARVAAQDPPPRIGPLVVDARGTVPLFKKDAAIGLSRGLDVSQLPGAGFGGDVGLHLYLFTWKAITLGIGGQLTFARSHEAPPASLQRGGSSPPAAR